jgi:hypothetical protein
MSPLGSLFAAIISFVASFGSFVFIAAMRFLRSFLSIASLSSRLCAVIFTSLRLVSMLWVGLGSRPGGTGIVAATWLQVVALCCVRLCSCFLMSSVFVRIFVIASLLEARFDASQAVASLSCQRRRVVVSISMSRFPPLIVSLLLFVVVCISVMIVVINASSVSGFFWEVSRSPRCCPVFCSIPPRPPPRACASLLLVGEGF